MGTGRSEGTLLLRGDCEFVNICDSVTIMVRYYMFRVRFDIWCVFLTAMRNACNEAFLSLCPLLATDDNMLDNSTNASWIPMSP